MLYMVDDEDGYIQIILENEKIKYTIQRSKHPLYV